MATTNFEDFYEVPNLNFDISKLKDDLDIILKLKKFLLIFQESCYLRKYLKELMRCLKKDVLMK